MWKKKLAANLRVYVCFHVRERVHVTRLKIYLKTGAADGFPESPSDSTQLHWFVGSIRSLSLGLNVVLLPQIHLSLPKGLCSKHFSNWYQYKANILAQEDFSLLVSKSETIFNFSPHPTLPMWPYNNAESITFNGRRDKHTNSNIQPSNLDWTIID